MSTTIDTTALFFGAPASLTVGGEEVGATMTAPKVTVKSTQEKPQFQGAGGPLKGAIFTTKIDAQVEFTINELSASKLLWSMPGATQVVGTATTTVTLGLATTLSADVLAGATSIVLTAATNVAAGKFLKVGDAAETEVVQVAPGYTTGMTIPLVRPLQRNHDSADPVVMVDDAGTTLTTWRTGRVPSSAFKDVVLDGIGLDGRHLVATVKDALSDGTLEVEMSDSAVAGTKVVMTGTYVGTDPTLAPIQIAVG